MYAVAADAVVVLHYGFLVFVATGGFLTWRWRRARYAHAISVVWAIFIVTLGQECPLTAVEGWLRDRAGEPHDGRGFIDRYVEDVVFPEAWTPFVWAAAAGLIAASYVLGSRRRRAGAHS